MIDKSLIKKTIIWECLCIYKLLEDMKDSAIIDLVKWKWMRDNSFMSLFYE